LSSDKSIWRIVEAPSSTRNRYVVVANPATHGNVDRIIGLIRSAAPATAKVDICYTDRVIPLDQLTDLSGEDIAAVIAVGGDGTVRAVASAIGAYQIPVGIVPAGSTNVIAQERGIPKDPDQAAALIFSSHAIYKMDAARCGNDRFLHMAGSGLDSRFFAATDHEAKRRMGWRAYVRPAIQQLSATPIRFQIVTDSQSIVVDSPLVLIANGRSILKTFLPIYPDIRSNDGWLDVLVFTPKSYLAIARTAAGFVSRTLPRSPYVTRVKAKHVELAADPPFPVQLDGDLYRDTPLTVDIEPEALSIIVPYGRDD
jgi:diacylglycerol kinase family enzyme